jgi:hypothetical protein
MNIMRKILRFLGFLRINLNNHILYNTRETPKGYIVWKTFLGMSKKRKKTQKNFF